MRLKLRVQEDTELEELKDWGESRIGFDVELEWRAGKVVESKMGRIEEGFEVELIIFDGKGEGEEEDKSIPPPRRGEKDRSFELERRAGRV